MAIPSSYTEAELQDYMVEITAAIASVIGLTAGNFYQAVNETLLSYGVDDIADATDIRKLQALARVEAWRYVADSTVAEYDVSRDSGETQVWDKRSQLHTQSVKRLEAARADAERQGYIADDATYNTVAFGTLTYSDDYVITEEES
jgi:hypothetical protein